MSAIRHLSWSQLSVLMNCGESYRRRYIEREFSPPGVNALIGSGSHSVIQANMLSKRDHGHLLTDEEVKQFAVDAFKRKLVKDDVRLTADQKAAGREKVLDEALDWAVKLAMLHHTELAPSINPDKIEHPWRLEIKGLPPIVGFIDLQEKPVGKEKIGMIRDTKNVAKSPKASEADESDQLTMYALYTYFAEKSIPLMALDSLVKTKTPKVVTQLTTRKKVHLRTLFDRIAVLVQQIEKGVFPPAPRSHWLCSEKYCAFYGSCKFVRGFNQI